MCSNRASHDTVKQKSKAAGHASLDHIPQPYCSCCPSAHKLLSPIPYVVIKSCSNPAIRPRPNPPRIAFSVMAWSIASVMARPIPVMPAPALPAFTASAFAVPASAGPAVIMSIAATPAVVAPVVPEAAVPVPVFQLGVLGHRASDLL